jgi:hypothetical protein
MRVEDDVVRPAQLHVAGPGVEHLDRAGLEVDALDAAAAIVLGLQDRPALARFLVPLEAAIVADVALAVGSDGGPVRPAARRRDDLLRAVRHHPRQGAGGDLDQHHRPVGHGHGPLGELQVARDFAHRFLVVVDWAHAVARS